MKVQNRHYQLTFICNGFVLTLLLFPFLSFSQNITIKGQILDAHLVEPIPFANIYLTTQPSIGTSSDFDGYYELLLSEIPDSVTISALGYATKTVAYSNRSVFNIKLNASAYALDAIVVTPTEDPAVALFRKILDHKKDNNPKALNQYQCEIYNKIELDLVNISEGFQNMAINRPFKFAFTKIDSTSEELPFLPAFLAETLSDYYYINSPKTEKEIVKANKVSGLNNASIAQLLGVMYQNINIYENWIPILTKEFVSPISDVGFNYYNYYMVDSAMIHNKWCYQVQFFPKSKSSDTFNGSFWVHDSTYAVKRVDLQLFENADLNFVEKITISQNFEHWQDSLWLPQNEFTVVSFDNIAKPLLLDIFSKKIKEGAPNIQGKRTTSYQDYQLQPIAKDSLNTISDLPIAQLDKATSYWKQNRHISLTSSEIEAQHLIDTIQQLKVFDTWRTVTTLIFSGYVPWKIFDIGNVYSFYNINPVEDNRFKLGLRTNSRFSKKLLIASYGAYGTRDQQFKFGINSLYLFQPYPRRALSATLLHDIRQTHQFNTDFSLSSEGVLASNFIRNGNFPLKLLDIRHYNVAYYQENKIGLSLRASIAHQWTSPYFNFSYLTDNQESVSNFKHTTLGLKLRFAYQEKFLSGVFNRVSLGSRVPIISVDYKLGLKDVLGGEFHFHQLTFNAFDRWDIAPLGYAKILFTAGRIWGTVPYLLLYIPQGNEGFISNYNGFNLIADYTFAVDNYVQFAIDHHFDGLIFNKIPLIKRLKLRSVANFRLLWGDMSSNNQIANAANLADNSNEGDIVRLQIPNQTPYMEVSAGIENILQVLRVDVIWQLNYRLPNIKNWGVRGNLHIKF